MQLLKDKPGLPKLLIAWGSRLGKKKQGRVGEGGEGKEGERLRRLNLSFKTRFQNISGKSER
jgi:hypothetical protein